MRAYRAGVLVFAAVFVALGWAILIKTALTGGGVGYVFGALFIALGAGRIFLLRRR